MKVFVWGFLLLGKEPVFDCEVFHVPKNETLENKKNTCYMRVVEIALAYIIKPPNCR